MSHPSLVAMPEEAHPAYADLAKVIRDWLDDDDRPTQSIRVPFIQRPLMASYKADAPEVQEVGFRVHAFRRERVMAPCPWAGEPATYWWWVAVDELGRQVSGRCRRQVVPWYVRLAMGLPLD